MRRASLKKDQLLRILLLGCRQLEALCEFDWIVYILCAFLKGSKCGLELEHWRILKFR